MVTKSSFVTSPISTTSKSAVVGAGVRRELHPAAVPAPVRDDHVVHPPAPLAAVEGDRDLGVLPGAGTRARARSRRSRGRRAPSTSSSPAARPRRSCRPSRRWRRTASPRRRPGRRKVTRPTSIVRGDAGRARPHRVVEAASGCRTCARSPGRCRRAGPRSRRRYPATPFTTSFSVPSPPTTTSRRPSAAASRASSVRWPGRSESSVVAVEPELLRAAVQRRPALAGRAVGARRVDEEDTGRFAHANRLVRRSPTATRSQLASVGDCDVEREPVIRSTLRGAPRR